MMKAENPDTPDYWVGASSVHPTGTVRYIPEKCYNGFTIMGAGEVDLVDMNGNLRQKWHGDGMPNKLFPDGKIITSPGRWKGGQQDGMAVQEFDFDGNLIWEFRKMQEVNDENGEKMWVARQHHDFQREGFSVGYYAPDQKEVEKGKTLILSHQNCVNPKIHPTLRLLDDVIIEVDYEGNIVWRWSASEHFDDLGFHPDAIEAMHKFPATDQPELMRHAEGEPKPGDGFDWFHQNCASYLGPNKWYDAGDERFHPDNIIINSREACFLAIIEKKSGKIVWKLAAPFSREILDKLGAPIIGAHGVHMIPKGLPGAGNILIFDNGGQAGYGKPNEHTKTGIHYLKRGWSRVIEIDPTNFEKVWEHRYTKAVKPLPGHFDFRFYSPFVSFAQRLPNGNTFVTLGDALRLVEITPEGEIVWEYIVPYASGLNWPLMYRAYRVPYSWVPQIEKPKEVAVTPPSNRAFHLPNDDGEMPQVYTVKK